jgi:L-histidine N-alpha-methyltransferase
MSTVRPSVEPTLPLSLLDRVTDVDRHDLARRQFLADVRHGLSRPQKTLPCKYFYDARGSKLFDQICELPEYYPTRTEMAILRTRLDEIADLVPLGAVLIEYGSGSSQKTRLLLDRLDGLAAYVPVDICGPHLLRSAQRLKARSPRLTIRPICADFTRPLRLPHFENRPRVLFFPGSTIGNFAPDDAIDLLRGMARLAGPSGGLLIGVDLLKSPDILIRAYDDRAGVTAAFNRNLLARINRELNGTFDLEAFAHRAVFNAQMCRIEMHLVSQRDQRAEVDGMPFHFVAGETIHTENSHKYSRESFADLADRAGWEVRMIWTDPQELFSVQYLVVR